MEKPLGAEPAASCAISRIFAKEEAAMTVKLYRTAYRQAKKLVEEGKAVHDDRDAWSEHQPSAADENEYIARHGMKEYGKWHLGVDDEAAEDTKAHYKFPYSDFKKVHRCALLSAESRAGRNKYFDIEKAAHELHQMIEKEKHALAP
jgi:hypothetical protein